MVTSWSRHVTSFLLRDQTAGESAAVVSKHHWRQRRQLVSDVTRESHLRIQIPVCGDVTPFVLQLQSLSHYVLGEVYIFNHFYMLCFLQRHCRNRDLGPWQVWRCDRYMSQYKTSRFTNQASSQATNKRSTTLFLPAWLHEPMKFIQRATSRDDWTSMTLILWFMTVHHRPQLLKLEEHPPAWKWFNDVVA